MGSKQVLPLLVIADLKVMAIKRYLEPHHQMLFSVIPRTPLFSRVSFFLQSQFISKGLSR